MSVMAKLKRRVKDLEKSEAKLQKQDEAGYGKKEDCNPPRNIDMLQEVQGAPRKTLKGTATGADDLPTVDLSKRTMHICVKKLSSSCSEDSLRNSIQHGVLGVEEMPCHDTRSKCFHVNLEEEAMVLPHLPSLHIT